MKLALALLWIALPLAAADELTVYELLAPNTHSFAIIYDVTQASPSSAQLIGKVYTGTLDEAGAKKVAQEFAADDLSAVHRLLDIELADAHTGTEGAITLDARRRWLDWTVLGYEQLAYE